ncbi:MAG: hypothetical protein LUC26_03310 [Prevotella sp.]|nr:hypothetical protein [Prevotella sp.]
MKKYIKPESKLIDLASHGCFAEDPGAYGGSVTGTEYDPAKGTDKWEPEQDVDLDW